MSSIAHRVIDVNDPSAVGEARRAAGHFATGGGLDETGRGRAALAATELANNLVKHAGGGRILIRLVDEAGRRGVEIIAIDAGPGIADVARSRIDGYSTSGTPGTGLGAVSRAATEFDLFSTRPGGTIAVARVLARDDGTLRRAGVRAGVIAIPAAGELRCGDSWALGCSDDAVAVVVADGLGHGDLAAAAAECAVAAFLEGPLDPPARVLERAHHAMRGGRGGAVAVLRVEPRIRAATYAGIGNITATVITGTERHGLLSHHGILGAQVRKIQELEAACSPSSHIVIHSDGVSARWDLDAHPGVRTSDPSIIAALLLRDHGRLRDDATVVVLALDA